MVEAAPLQIHLEPFFMDSPRGPLFCIYRRPEGQKSLGGIVYIHPFAEEMHKSRRMAAQMARAFAGAGYSVLSVDLTGCGDSAGDFGDAGWNAWKSDVALAIAWLHERQPGSVALWGLRAGAALAVDVAQETDGVDRLILWQPMVNGEQFLNHFLRIKLASEMLSEGQAQNGTKVLRVQLEKGQSVEVGGYLLSPALARDLSAWRLIDKVPSCPTDWFEISTGGDLGFASKRVIDAWITEGVPLHVYLVEGEPFWLTQEITECPALLDATLKANLV